ncbi:hypothetical protein [Bacillus paramycoides]|uniref:Uncharacterized protein n=1 Tax=Bacillus paramycoides TaxID=2026194 RepID=A0ABU6MXY1_9BACI|nr:hypothetical protein [Bacillus paramycoides]
MIDKRDLKDNDHEIDNALNEITDTSILLNFQKTIVNLYPQLIPIHAFAYDGWENIAVPLCYEMVYKTFAFKYGINIEYNETHSYMFSLNNYKGIKHIECIPKNTSFKALIHDEWIEIGQSGLKDQILVFKAFGDGLHSLIFGLEVEEAHKVSFDLVEVDVFSTITGHCSKSSVFIDKEDLEFEFVAETYNAEIHG